MIKSTQNIKKEIKSIIDIYKSRDLSKAELLCRKLIAEHLESAFLYNLLGLILTEQGKIEEAIKKLKSLI